MERNQLFVAENIGLVGYGYVGSALGLGFEQASQGRDRIVYYDKYKSGGRPLREVIERSKFIFIALPTPMKANESGIDLSIIDENLEQIIPLTNNTDKIVIIKSTVVPGTTKAYQEKYPQTNFCFNPEFLTERNFLQDFMNAERTVIGANDDLTSRSAAVFYQMRFPKSQIFQTDPTTAEMIKYFTNAYLATKVTFANTMYDLCQGLGISYDEVKDIASLDPRIGTSHLDVTSLRGFGGKCLPKDLVALLGEFSRLNIDDRVLKSIWDYNKLVRGKVRGKYDWEEIPGAVEGNDSFPGS